MSTRCIYDCDCKTCALLDERASLREENERLRIERDHERNRAEMYRLERESARDERDAYRAQVDALMRKLGEAQRCEHADPPGRVEP